MVITVCGAGTMGSGIAEAAARQGIKARLYDVDESALGKAKSSIEKRLQQQLISGKISPAEKEKIFSSLSFSSNPQECICDVLIEAIVENMEMKSALFQQFAAIHDETTILATNTSSLSVTKLAEQVAFPDRVIGMHFFNPATLMKLVELVHTPYTSNRTVQIITDLAQQMGKIPVHCQDAPGFIVNHVARPYYLEALRILESEKISPQAIDTVLESTGFRMGPFRLMDLIGNDINYTVSCSVYDALGKPARLKPSSTQEKMVAEKRLGRKTGSGYYDYNEK